MARISIPYKQKNMNYYDEFDQESQALLHGIKPLDFEEVMGSKQQDPFGDFAINTSNTAIGRKNPLAYSPLSKSGADVRDNFFQGSKTYSNNNLQIIVDPSSGIDPYKKIIPIERGFYYDKNNNDIQDEDEKYVVTIKLFIAKEATQLTQIYEDPTIKPDPKEILFFLEDNDKDFSGTTLYIKRGNQVDAALNELLAKSETFTSYIKSKYGISLSDLQELIKKGVVKNNIQNFIFSIVELASFIISNPAIFKGIALGIKKAVDTIKETCIIEEKNWNPQKAEGNFSPFLFPFAPALDVLDDKAINDFIKSGIQKLSKEANAFDKKIENTLNLISKAKIQTILPFSLNIPETFTDLLLMKYRELRLTMDGIISNLNNIDFTTLIKDGLNMVNAFFCGIWNGFVEAVCGIISLVQYLFDGAEFLTDLLKNFKEKGPALLEKIDDIILHFQQIDFGKIFTKLATDIKEWVLSDSTISLVELAYFSGMFIGIVVELVIEIVFGALFTGGTLSIATIMTKLGETFKALGSLLLSIIKAPFKLAGKTISAFAEGLQWLSEFLKKGTDEILRIIDEVFSKIKVIEEEIILIDKIDDIFLPLIRILYKNPSFIKCINLVNENRFLGKWIAIELEAMIKLYTANTFIILNKALRGIDNIKLDKELKAMRKILDEALEKLPISKYNNQILQRSAFFTEKEIKKLFKVGKDFIDKGFMSTTYSDEALKVWLQDNPSHNVVFKIFGKNGKLIEEASMLPYEAEVLFKSGTEFTVEAVRKIDHPIQNRARNGEKAFEIILKEK